MAVAKYFALCVARQKHLLEIKMSIVVKWRTMTRYHDIMTNWHCSIMTMWQFRWNVRYFVCTWWNWNPMYILSLHCTHPNKILILEIFDHTYPLIIYCAEWMKWSCFTRKLCLSPVWVSASALLPCHFTGGKMWTLKMGMLRNTFHFLGIFSDSEVEYHWEQTLIFHLPKHMLQHDWKVAPSPASPCRPSWSAAASSASPRRCSWRGAACGCGCWRSGQVSTVSQPQHSPH